MDDNVAGQEDDKSREEVRNEATLMESWRVTG